MVPLYILFPFLMLAIWGLGFFQGYFARKDREAATRPPLTPYPPLTPAPPRWEPAQAERVVYPGQPRHSVPRRLGVLPRRSPTRPPRGAGPARRTHEKISS